MALSLQLVRQTVTKQAGQMPMSPGQQAMMNAAKIATPPGAQTPMPPIQPQTPGEVVSEEQQQMEAEKLEQERRKELDKKDQELNSVRADLEMAKLELEKEKIRSEQKEREMQMSADLQKREMAAIQSMKQEQRALEQQQNKLEIAEAKHQAELERATAAEQAKIEQSKSKALVDIAKTEADRYIKTTDEAKRNADAYFDERKKALDEARSGISPALQSQMESAIAALNGLNKLKAKSNPGLNKLANNVTQDKPRAISSPSVPVKSNPTAGSKPYKLSYEENKRLNNYLNRVNSFQSSTLKDQSATLARMENHSTRLKDQNADPTQLNGLNRNYEYLKKLHGYASKQIDRDIAKGDKDAWLQKFDYDNFTTKRHLDRTTGWGDTLGITPMGYIRGIYKTLTTDAPLLSDRDMMAQAYTRQKNYDARSSWAGDEDSWTRKGVKFVQDLWDDSIGGGWTQNTIQSYLNSKYVSDMYDRAGAVQDWVGDGSGAPEYKLQAIREALADRDLNASKLRNFLNITGNAVRPAAEIGAFFVGGPVAGAAAKGIMSGVGRDMIIGGVRSFGGGYGNGYDLLDPRRNVPTSMQDAYRYEQYIPANKWDPMMKSSGYNPHRTNVTMLQRQPVTNPNKPWWAGIVDMAAPYISNFTGGMINFGAPPDPQMTATRPEINTGAVASYALKNPFAHRVQRKDGFVNDEARYYNNKYQEAHGSNTLPRMINNPLLLNYDE